MLHEAGIICRICCHSLYRKQFSDALYLRQKRCNVTTVSRRDSYIQNDTVIRVQHLMAEVVHPPWFARAFEIARPGIGMADLLLVVSHRLFQWLCPLFAAFASLSGKFLQALFFVCIQTIPVHTGFYRHIHHVFRFAGGICLDMR